MLNVFLISPTNFGLGIKVRIIWSSTTQTGHYHSVLTFCSRCFGTQEIIKTKVDTCFWNALYNTSCRYIWSVHCILAVTPYVGGTQLQVTYSTTFYSPHSSLARLLLNESQFGVHYCTMQSSGQLLIRWCHLLERACWCFSWSDGYLVSWG